MDYKKYGSTYYVRMDKGDEIISSISDFCGKEGIKSAVYSGIGGCGAAEIQTFDPENNTYETRELSGMLELVSINGSVASDDAGNLCQHTHAMFAYKEDGEHAVAGGHLKSATVLITAEIELRPVTDGAIFRRFDPGIGLSYWDFGE